MAHSWPTRLVTPHPLGGAAKLQAQVSPSAYAVRAILHVAVPVVPPATAPVGIDPNAPPVGAVVVDLDWISLLWSGMAWGAPGATACSWFVKTSSSSAWEAGPVVAIALPTTLLVDVSIPTDWIINRLSDYATAFPPLRTKPFAVARTYPRNDQAWPAASVQVDSFSPVPPVVGDNLSSTGPLIGEQKSLGSPYSVGFGITVWCASPEDRKVLTPWLAEALEALKFCCRDFKDLANPSFSLSEHEDFQTLQVPAFVVQGRFNGTIWSSLKTTISNNHGRVTVP